MTRLAIWLVAMTAAAPVIMPQFFPYRQGWLGADAAYSIPLDTSSTVWLFGDTFTGPHRDPKTMIHNSIALRKCKANGACGVSYWWSGMQARHASSFFKTPESDYYWPLDGFVYRQKLYIFLEQMHATGDGGAFGFDYTRIVLAAVSNFKARPDTWQISYRVISTGNKVVPGIAAVMQPRQSSECLYVFTLFRKSSAAPFVGLLRFPVKELADVETSTSWQYLTREGEWLPWQRSTAPADAAKVLNGNITEMSVAFHPDRHQWVAVYPKPTLFSGAAAFSTSGSLEGPWNAPRAFFSYPEMNKEDPRYTPHVFCYAAKEHPELEVANQMAITYACNSTHESEVLRDMRLYRPELVKQSLPSR